MYVNLALEEDLVHGEGGESLVVFGITSCSPFPAGDHLGLAQMNGMASLVLVFNFWGVCIQVAQTALCLVVMQVFPAGDFQ